MAVTRTRPEPTRESRPIRDPDHLQAEPVQGGPAPPAPSAPRGAGSSWAQAVVGSIRSSRQLTTGAAVLGAVVIALVAWKGLTAFFAVAIVGVSVGSIYAIAATGLVVTYTTSGIFNLAHGAIGMLLAFAYWQLYVQWGVPAPLALVIVLLVAAPILGATLDLAIMSRFAAASETTTTVVTIGLLLILVGGATTIWGPEARVLPGLFGQRSVKWGGVVIEWNKLAAVVIAAALAAALGFFFKRTRTGVAMRAIVDNRDLTALACANPVRLSALAWALGSMCAGIAGILLAPLLQLDIIILTFLVINAYAAAMIGRLRSVPLTFAGGIGLGLFEAALVGYLPPGGLLGSLRPAAPFIVLFVLLCALPRQRQEREARGGVLREPLSARVTVVLAVAGVLATAVVSGLLKPDQLVTASSALAFSLILLSLVLLTGLSGQLSLGHMAFVGIGAVFAAKSGLPPALAILLAGVITAPIGAAIALPALRVRGVFLALATLAFGYIMDTVVFVQRALFYGGEALGVDRPSLFGVSFVSERAFLILLSALFGLMGIAVVAIQRGSLGRALAAMNDSPTAASVLGLNLVRLKFIVFMLSAGMAGMAGAVFAAQRVQISSMDVSVYASLTLILIAVIAGVSSVTGALIGGLVFAVLPQLFGPGGVALAIGIGAATLARRSGGLAELFWDNVRSVTPPGLLRRLGRTDA